MLPVLVPTAVVCPDIALLEGAGLDVGLEGAGLTSRDGLSRWINGGTRDLLNFLSASRVPEGILSQKVSCRAYEGLWVR